MGQAKRLMMEMEEATWEPSDVYFRCPTCKKKRLATTELPVVYDDGEEVVLPVTVLCSHCHSDFEGWVTTDWSNCTIELNDFPKTKIDAEPAQGSWSHDNDYDLDLDYFEWLEDQKFSTRPVLHAFDGTLKDIEALSENISHDQRSQMLARMLLSQSITALEVFLSDTLTLAVRNRSDVQEKLLRSRSLEIGSTQFKLEDAIGIENFSQDRLLAHLSSVSFHNLKKVSNLFQIGLGIKILPEDATLSTIERAVRMRHDCVHRNGLDRTTGIPHVIDKKLLDDLRTALFDMVTSVDKQVEIKTSDSEQEIDLDF